jgi:hypothetical protein
MLSENSGEERRVPVRRPRCLVLLAFEALSIGTVAEHAFALRDFSEHDVELVHIGTLNWLNFDLGRFDVIVFHYSIVIARGYHIRPALRERLAGLRALKVLFIQDEYRWIDATAEAIREFGISVIFTVLNRDIVDKVYHHEWLRSVRKEITLTGFVDESLLGRAVPNYTERRVDVAYRGRTLPYWLGSFAMEKLRIGERFREAATKFGLSHDISSDEGARIYGGRWIEFVAGAKAILGTESGASVFDFTGEIRSRVDQAVNSTPQIGFEAIRRDLLEEIDGKIVVHVISPRIFEAAALKTLMINYPGEYSGRLTPWRHYVPLARDHSNVDEVIGVIRNSEQAQRIIEAAYREVACNPENSFRAMAAHFDRVVREELCLGEVLYTVPRKIGFRILASRRLEVLSWVDSYARRRGGKFFRWAWRMVEPILPVPAQRWIKGIIVGQPGTREGIPTRSSAASRPL